MEKLEQNYSGLVRAVKTRPVRDDEIKAIVVPGDFWFFERYLSDTISSLDEIDVSAEKRIAEASGYMAALYRRIKRTRKWKKALALRTLSYFRDPKNIPMLLEVIDKEMRLGVILAAGIGLALCGDIDSLQKTMEKASLVSQSNEDILLVLLAAYGKEAVPIACQALKEKALTEKETYVAVDFLGLYRHKPAVSELIGMLSSAYEPELLVRIIESLELIGDGQACSAIIPFLQHEDFRVRIAAARAIGVLGGMRYVDDLQKLLKDDNWWVARLAAEALARIGKEGVAHLEMIAQTGEQKCAKMAKFMLAEVKFNRLK